MRRAVRASHLGAWRRLAPLACQGGERLAQRSQLRSERGELHVQCRILLSRAHFDCLHSEQRDVSAVHPGSLDLKDDVDTATKLFILVNIIVEQMISNPKHVEELYDKLPEAKRRAIDSGPNVLIF
jgi:hypothetical protein